MDKTDGELVTATLDGDPHAFREIVERYQRLVFNIVYHYLGYREEAEDLAQEVFLKVFRSLESFDTDRSLKSWISRITSNSCLDELRKTRTRRVRLFSDLGQDEETQMEYYFNRFQQSNSLTEGEEQDLFGLLAKSMETLSEKDKMAFVLRELEGLSYAEISEVLRTSELAVRIRVSRAKKKLYGELSRTLYPGRKQEANHG